MFKRLMSYVKEHRKNYVGLIVFITLSGLLAGVFPLISGKIVDSVIVPMNRGNLKYFAIAVFVQFLAAGTTQYLFIYNGGKVEVGLAYQLRKAGFNKLQKLSLSYYDRNSTGQILSRITSDISNIARVLTWDSGHLIFGISSIIIMTILMLVTHLKLALMVMAIMPFIYAGGFFVQNVIFKKYKKVREISGKISGQFNEGIMGSMTVKTLSREEQSYNEFRKKSARLKSTSIRAGLVSGMFTPYIIVLGGVATAIALYSGGKGVIEQSGLTYGTFVSFIFYSISFYVPIFRVSESFIRIQGAKASAVRVFEVLDTEEEIIDSKIFSTNEDKIEGDIEFKNVNFSYIKNEPVLKDFCLKVNRGECIALVGETGGGKSTIVNLACRFYEPTEGRILIDGEDYKAISQEKLHHSLGYVLQTPYLFNDTIINNIKYGNLNATEEQIVEACKLVNAHDFIIKLEKGYSTKAGENGRLLSSGQRQLLALARAVIADPSLFILDEATATVDSETEKQIQDAINSLLKGRTSFIIAHRLTTIVNADRILVINGGQIVEEGNHQELLAKRGHYFNLYIKQFYDEKEALLLK